MITDLAPKLVGIKEASEVGLLISMQVYETLLICEHAVGPEPFVEAFPQHNAEEEADELVWIGSDDPKESLGAARLAKIQYLRRYENLITGLMRDDYHRDEDFDRVVSSAFVICKTGLNGIASKTANLIFGITDVNGIETILRENVAEVLAELPKYDAYALQPKEYIAQTTVPAQIEPEPEEG